MIAQKGIGFVPENNGIFEGLTVAENLIVAARNKDKAADARQEWVLELFPDLKKAWKRDAGNLSGGERQMLSLALAFINENELLLIDEPSKGLAPLVVEKLMQAVTAVQRKTTVVLVEQNLIMASVIGDRYYIIDDGVTVHSGDMAALKENRELKKRYLGIA